MSFEEKVNELSLEIKTTNEAVIEGLKNLEDATMYIGSSLQEIETIRKSLDSTIESSTLELKTVKDDLKRITVGNEKKTKVISKLSEKNKTLQKQFEQNSKESTNLSNKISDCNSENEILKSLISKNEAEINVKQQKFESEQADRDTIDTKAVEEMSLEKDGMKVLEENYPAMEYIQSRELSTETTKADILAVIASNKMTTTQDIKEKVTAITPVQITRFLNRLQADEIIVQNEDTWKLSADFQKDL